MDPIREDILELKEAVRRNSDILMSISKNVVQLSERVSRLPNVEKKADSNTARLDTHGGGLRVIAWISGLLLSGLVTFGSYITWNTITLSTRVEHMSEQVQSLQRQVRGIDIRRHRDR